MNYKNMLYLGDTITIAIITLIGFATHSEIELSFLPRMGTTFFPVLIGWFLLAPWFGLFDENITADPKNIWRVALTTLFSAPLAAVLRSILLNSAIIPIFAAVLGITNALGMTLWRWIFTRFINSKLNS